MSAWIALSAADYPHGRMFMVRSRTIPIGTVNPADKRVYAFAHAGKGQRPGLWALNAFWPDEPRKEDNGLYLGLWEEWAEVPA